MKKGDSVVFVNVWTDGLERNPTYKPSIKISEVYVLQSMGKERGTAISKNDEYKKEFINSSSIGVSVFSPDDNENINQRIKTCIKVLKTTYQNNIESNFKWFDKYKNIAKSYILTDNLKEQESLLKTLNDMNEDGFITIIDER